MVGIGMRCSAGSRSLAAASRRRYEWRKSLKLRKPSAPLITRRRTCSCVSAILGSAEGVLLRCEHPGERGDREAVPRIESLGDEACVERFEHPALGPAERIDIR